MRLIETHLILAERTLGRPLCTTQQLDLIVQGESDGCLVAEGVATFVGTLGGEYDGFVIREGETLARGVVSFEISREFLVGDTISVKVRLDVLAWRDEEVPA